MNHHQKQQNIQYHSFLICIENLLTGHFDLSQSFVACFIIGLFENYKQKQTKKKKDTYVRKKR